jgi:uncharacterized protein (TIGR02265 family)
MTQGSFFVGLFEKGLRVQAGPLADALLEVGYDIHRPKGEYPITVWNDALRVTWKHLWPEKSYEQAYRDFGRRFFDGFAQTMVGAVLAVGLPVLGPERFLRRLPQYMKVDTYSYRVETREEAPRHWLLVFRNDPDAKPDFIAGLVEASLLRIGVQATVDVTFREPTHFDLTVRW